MLVVVGRIGRAHGIRGDLGVDIRTDEPERRFAPGSSVIAGTRTLTIVSTRQHSGRLIVRFDGVNDRTAAETLHGTVLEAEVTADELPEDPEEFYDHQLIGLEVRTGDTVIGTITQVIHLPAQDTLAVKAGEREILIPFVRDLVPELHVAAGYVLVADLPGLLNPDEAVDAAPDMTDPA